MRFGWLKRYVPRSLFGRAALILLVPILTIQVVVTYVFIQRLYENVTVQMTRSVLVDVALVQSRWSTAPDTASAVRTARAVAEPLDIRLLPDSAPPVTEGRQWDDFSGRIVSRELQDALPNLTTVDLATDDKRVRLALDTPHGPLRLDFARNRASASNPHQLLVLMIFVGFVVTLISFLFLKNQIRPIRHLAEAAADFGKGRVMPYRPSGATEVRSAGAAFLDMRARIERHIEQRTLMLSGVSHDLRTPLTRLKLGITLLPENEDSQALLRDVAEMEQMLDTFLGFARVDATEDPEPVDPVALAERLVAKARRSAESVQMGPVSGEGRVAMRPLAVERALENLIGNAARHGTRALVSVAITERAVKFTVEDNGPGIPEAQREEAIKPFSRLDSARNQDRGGGVGLGLSIVRDIARQHGGALRLGESAQLGGLQADLIIAR